jgi:5-methylcytosine-specific restriction endonuclease McrA
MSLSPIVINRLLSQAAMSDPIQPTSLSELFAEAKRLGNKRYNRLTAKDFDNYRSFDYWRYINGDYECGTTEESKVWVRDHSDYNCPICGNRFGDRLSGQGGRTIDHKLPRAQYPWLAMEFSNFWVICRLCNRQKGERHWYEYEHFIFTKHPDLYDAVRLARPVALLRGLGR